MASRVIVSPPKLLRTLSHFTRPLNSSSSSSSIAVHLTDNSEPNRPPSATASSVLNLDDAEKLFSSVPTMKLFRASANLHAAAIEPMVDFGTWLMKSKLMDVDVVRGAILGAIRHTFYEHFCAGEDAVSAGRTVRRLDHAGLRAMLTYAVEYAADNDSCDRNLDAFLHTVESSKSLPPSVGLDQYWIEFIKKYITVFPRNLFSQKRKENTNNKDLVTCEVSFVIVKITAICPKKLLERVSDLLRWQHKDPSFNLPWKLDTLPIFSDSSPTYHTLRKPEPLTPQEEHDLQLGHQRLQKICQKCVEANIRLTVDAEHSFVQPAIDYFTYSSAILYNRDDNPIMFGTIQCYLKDAKERLLLASKAADKMSVPMGFKLVRGAYMSSESKLASSLGFESPIHNGIEETHECYNDCASIMLEKIANGPGALVLATHNVESGRVAVAKAHDLGIGKVHQKLQFAQLYGMADVLSFSLRNAGFQVSKYMPFGPVEMVIPYLLRRAEENRGLLSASTLDRQLIRKELKRRLMAAVF